MLRKPYALVGCKLYKCVAVVTCLALTWVRGVTDVVDRGGVMVVDRWVVAVFLMVDQGGLWMGLMVDRGGLWMGFMVDQGGVVVCARGLFGVWDEFLYWGFWV